MTVRDPAVLRVTAKVRVPATRAALAGRVALASELVMATVGVADVDHVPVGVDRVDRHVDRGTRGDRRSGVPVLPVGLPGGGGLARQQHLELGGRTGR